jgi:hypothetical protein
MNKFTKAIAAIMLIVAAIIVTGCNKPDEPNNGGNNNGQNDSIVNPNDNGGNNNGQNDSIVDHSGTLNGHDYVDLGLPSGTLWATCNVGANIPENYGNYYAWGEVVPKTNYTWNTYKYCNDGNSNQLTKYCIYSGYGCNDFVDSLTILQIEDDAATANWGIGWYTPTYDQWRELTMNISGTWTTQNDVHGFLFTSGNGSSLFLPATGVGMSSGPLSIDRAGYYWSSSLDTGADNMTSDKAWRFFFNEHFVSGIWYEPRMSGLTIRAVVSGN